MKTAGTLLFAATLLASLLVISASLVVDPVSLSAAAILLAFLLAATVPRAAICTALFALPLGGNRPGTTHSVVTVLVGASLLLGFTVRAYVLRRQSKETLLEGALSSPILAAGLLYSLVSVLSLSSIPLPHLLADLRNSFDSSSLFFLAFSIKTALSVNEHSLIYSALSPFLSLLSFFLGVFVWRECHKNIDAGRLFLSAALGGLLFSFVGGLLDYYGFISLLSFRPLDHVVNPGNHQFRLQSFFAHSGWYAEYITLAIPTCLVLLSLRAPFWLRTGAILFCLALGEFVLILTYQRGGWLSYPLTLVAVWSAIYVVRLIETQNAAILPALKRSALKVLISLPLTVALSLALVWGIQRGSSTTEALSPYVSRFKEIQRTGDRTAFLFAGTLIGLKHPILGGGPDSFAWQFEREFVSPSGSHYKRYDLPLHGSAHNVYAQTFSGKGLVGLLALLALPVLLLQATKRAIADRELPLTEKLTVLTGGCFACAFLIYGNVQEVFYVQALQFLFFAIVGIVGASAQPPASPRALLASNRALTLLALIFSAHLFWEYVAPAPTRKHLARFREFGCSPIEHSPDPTHPTKFQWCGERSALLLPRSATDAPLTLTLEAGPLAQTVQITADGESSTHTLAPGERKTLALSPSALDPAQPVEITLTASNSFVPAILTRGSTDTRRLAFRVIW